MTQNLPNKAFIMAELSAAAYEEPNIAKRIFQQYNFQDYKFISRHGAQCYILWRETDIVIIFRGTEPKQWSDIKADLDARQRTGLHNHGKVHKGFQGELEKVWNDLKRQINYILEGSYDIDIHITGHSLGGAMATICAKRLDEELDAVCCLYTFGSPRVGNKKWCKSLQVPHYRFQNNNDIVCRMPLWIMGYRHHGKNMYINYKGKIVKYRWWRRMIDNLRGRLRAMTKFQLFDGIYDHDITKYAKRVNNVVLDD